jgi:hypothetical protein
MPKQDTRSAALCFRGLSQVIGNGNERIIVAADAIVRTMRIVRQPGRSRLLRVEKLAFDSVFGRPSRHH